ncbi:hypothetical protein AX16_002481 [Volvariella volvacea WC 439]|nr:hypothetical protein AX16_002481 [Volvariella volvacea WC 439]
MGVSWLALALTLGPLVLLPALYITINDRKLKAIPPRVEALSPQRWTAEYVKKEAAKFAEGKRNIKYELPPKTGRRYIVVGGAGFLGGWIVNQLLERGEDPHRIRLVDLRQPARPDMIEAISKGVQFIKTDVSDAASVDAAFTAPWPKSASDVQPPEGMELTVFHTAANIRFFERTKALLYRSSSINLVGTQNVVSAAKKAGATVLVYTSSASIGIRRSFFFLWPWQEEPENFVQVINDDESSPLLPKDHDEFFSNYAVSKGQAEQVVRGADKSQYTYKGKTKVLRTGALRPGNGVFGPRGDMLLGAYMIRETNPSWIHNVVQSFTYVENCALAHLLYERQLIRIYEQSSDSRSPASPRYPDIGGQAFLIADPAPGLAYGDVYTALSTLTFGKTTFPPISGTGLLALAYVMECYYTTREYLLTLWPNLFKDTPIFGALLPALGSDLINLQPSLWALTSVHVIFDDSRARLSPEKGGLGYTGLYTTMEGVCRTVEEHLSGVGIAGARSADAGVGFGFKRRHANGQ